MASRQWLTHVGMVRGAFATDPGDPAEPGSPHWLTGTTENDQTVVFTWFSVAFSALEGRRG